VVFFVKHVQATDNPVAFYFFAPGFRKEVQMFETLMKPGSYRVDYFKDQVAGTKQALGFYACGEIPSQTAYSRTARHNLLAGLIVIQHHFGISNLVAIYLDVHSANHATRPAFDQMKRDLCAGLFKRAFVFNACTLLDGQDILKDLAGFYGEIDGFELITFKNGVCITLPPNEETRVDLKAVMAPCLNQ